MIVSSLILSVLSVTVTAFSGMVGWYLFFNIFEIRPIYFVLRRNYFLNNSLKSNCTRTKNYKVGIESKHKVGRFQKQKPELSHQLTIHLRIIYFPLISLECVVVPEVRQTVCLNILFKISYSEKLKILKVA